MLLCALDEALVCQRQDAWQLVCAEMINLLNKIIFKKQRLVVFQNMMKQRR